MIYCKDRKVELTIDNTHVKFKDGEAGRCRSCHKHRVKLGNIKHSNKKHTSMKSTKKWRLKETYSTKGLNKRDTMALFMDAVLSCEMEAEKERVDW